MRKYSQVICRRCAHAPGFYDYDYFRAHLRAEHRIKVFPTSDLVLYETSPGSSLKLRNYPVHPPPLSAGPSFDLQQITASISAGE